MRNIIALSIALALAAPAHAQLLGGGLAGGLGGSIGGTLGGAGSIGGMGGIGSSMDTIRSTTESTAHGSGGTSGSQSVNRKSGAVHADRAANAAGGGTLSQTVATPAHMISGSASGEGSASGSGSADAQLIGTDAIRGTARSVRSQATGAASGAAQTSHNLAGSAVASGSSAASGSGSASGTGTGSTGPLALAGSAAAAGDGAFSVSNGTPVIAPDGEKIGKVREVVADAHGRVQELLVNVDGKTALLPATNFSATGSGVLSAMSEGQIGKTADQQKADNKAADKGDNKGTHAGNHPSKNKPN